MNDDPVSVLNGGFHGFAIAGSDCSDVVEEDASGHIGGATIKHAPPENIHLLVLTRVLRSKRWIGSQFEKLSNQQSFS